MLCFFFFNDTATTEIYTLSLHDALPILVRELLEVDADAAEVQAALDHDRHAGDRQPDQQPEDPLGAEQDRKSTRLNFSHANISYAVFCLKKKKTKNPRDELQLREKHCDL